MSTNAGENNQGGDQSQQQPPRDDQGRFQPAPVQSFQPPPTPASDAERFYSDFNDPARANEALLREAQRQGIVPPGMSPDDLRIAAQQYAEFQRQGANYQPPQPAGPTPGYQTPPGLQPGPNYGQPQYAPQPPQPGFQQGWGDPNPWEPDYVDPQVLQQQIVQGVVQVLDQREQMREQQRMQAEQNMRIQNLQAAVGQVASQENLPDEQAQALLDNVAVALDRAMQQGQQIDFSVEGLTQAATGTLNNLRQWGAPPPPPAVDAQQQQAIARHRGIAPQTTTPQGPAQSGPASPPRGLRGAAQRIASGGL